MGYPFNLDTTFRMGPLPVPAPHGTAAAALPGPDACAHPPALPCHFFVAPSPPVNPEVRLSVHLRTIASRCSVAVGPPLARTHRRRTQEENDDSAGHARCLCACCDGWSWSYDSAATRPHLPHTSSPHGPNDHTPQTFVDSAASATAQTAGVGGCKGYNFCD